MNWLVYSMEISVLLVLFAGFVTAAITRDPRNFVSDFPPEIQKVYYASQNIPVPKTTFTARELLRKILFSLALMFLLAWMAKRAGARGYLQGFFVIFSYLAAIAAFDTFILDWIFFPRIRRWRLPGTEHMDREYRVKWFHLKVVLQVSPLFLVYALLTAGIFIWLF